MSSLLPTSGVTSGQSYRSAEEIDSNTQETEYKLLGRKYTFGFAIASEVVELVGAVATFALVMEEAGKGVLGGLIPLGIGMAGISIVEGIVVNRGRAAGIPLNTELICRLALRILGGMILVAGYFTTVAGYASDDNDLMKAGVITLSTGIVTGVAGLGPLFRYL